MPVTDGDFLAYLDAQLADRDWTLTDLATHSGLSSSVIFRYRRGYQPTVTNARTIASTLDVPLLDVLVASGVLSRAEAQHGLSETDTSTLLAEISTVDLAQEQLNRAHVDAERHRRHEAQRAELADLAGHIQKFRLAATDHADFQAVASQFKIKRTHPDHGDEGA